MTWPPRAGLVHPHPSWKGKLGAGRPLTGVCGGDRGPPAYVPGMAARQDGVQAAPTSLRDGELGSQVVLQGSPPLGPSLRQGHTGSSPVDTSPSGWGGDVTLMPACARSCLISQPDDESLRVCSCPRRLSGPHVAAFPEGTSECGVNSDAAQGGGLGGVAVTPGRSSAWKSPRSSRQLAGLEDTQSADEAQRGPAACSVSPSTWDGRQATPLASGESGAGTP